MGVVVEKGLPCSACGSSDAVAKYDDGSMYCFSGNCEIYFPPEGDPELTEQTEPLLREPLEFLASASRKLSEATMRHWGVGHTTKRALAFPQVDPYGTLIGYKLKSKSGYTIAGKAQKGLWGEHLWTAKGKLKRVFITEGELDALSISEVQDNQWPVVSLPAGCKSVEKAFAASADFLAQFDQIVIAFDQDPEGREATKKALSLIPPGKGYTMPMPRKDASDVLTSTEGGHGRTGLRNCLWSLKPYSPVALVARGDYGEQFNKPLPTFLPTPWESLNDVMVGLPIPGLVMLAGGSGCGKSTIMRELGVYYSQAPHNMKVGYIALEESVQDTTMHMAGILVDRPLKVQVGLAETPQQEFIRRVFDDPPPKAPSPDLEVAAEAMRQIEKDFVTIDHYGSLSRDVLEYTVRAMVQAHKCSIIFLDHISMVVSGSEGAGERKLIDQIMTTLVALKEELGICIVCVSHVKRPDQGDNWEEGRMPCGADLRGSGGLEQMSHVILGVARDMANNSNIIRTSVLKNRDGRMLGDAATLRYDMDTGRLSETQAENHFTETKEEY